MSTGWPAGMMQDDCRQLSKWLATRPNAKQEAREAAQNIMSTELDCYGMTPEERAEFDEWLERVPKISATSQDLYCARLRSERAEAWAACAKPYRKRLEHADVKLGKQAREVECLTSQAEDLRAFARKEAEHSSELLLAVKRLEAENARLRVDAARLDFLEEAVPDVRAQCDQEMSQRGRAAEGGE